MQEKTIRKILDNDEDLNIEDMAKAILDEKKREEKKKKRIPSTRNSIIAWNKIKIKQREEEALRQRIAKVWPENKKS
jgi:hypothetical protein